MKKCLVTLSVILSTLNAFGSELGKAYQEGWQPNFDKVDHTSDPFEYLKQSELIGEWRMTKVEFTKSATDEQGLVSRENEFGLEDRTSYLGSVLGFELFASQSDFFYTSLDSHILFPAVDASQRYYVKSEIAWLAGLVHTKSFATTAKNSMFIAQYCRQTQYKNEFNFVCKLVLRNTDLDADKSVEFVGYSLYESF